ncbi:MAG: hypothetical protein HRT90_09050 [Candidatus Margulisbacteria bacterium]|nr:hypothetical protein [Candidatus Margulisiibacteriota bacterium]
MKIINPKTGQQLRLLKKSNNDWDILPVIDRPIHGRPQHCIQDNLPFHPEILHSEVEKILKETRKEMDTIQATQAQSIQEEETTPPKKDDTVTDSGEISHTNIPIRTVMKAVMILTSWMMAGYLLLCLFELIVWTKAF